MKIVFLDIDGVLNGPVSSWEGFPHSHIDPVMVARLNVIVSATDAKVVISSSWRFKYEYDELARILKDQGFEGEVIGQTPKFNKRARGMSDYVNMQRGHDIQEWLDDCGMDIESFVILDDVPDMVHLKKHLVLTQSNVGLTDKHVEKALKLLMK